MEKINVSQLLKDCPTGMELDCTMYNKVTLLSIDDREDINFPIRVLREDGSLILLTKYGQYANVDFAKCIIFPKGKTTWEGFVSPRDFKDGDILVGKANQPFIFQSFNWIRRSCFSYCGIDVNERFQLYSDDWTFANSLRFATEEEKQMLFKAIENNGYKWNEKTKTIEKLIKPIFKKGDKIRVKNGVSEPRIIDDVYDTFYTLVPIGTINFTEQDKWELVPNKIEPKFKVDDWITNGEYTWKVISVDYLDYTLQNQLGESVYDTIDYVNKAFHLWTINDAKDGDVLFHSDSASNGIFIFKEISQRETIQNIQKVICYCDYDSEDGFCLGENHTCCWTDSKILYPATEERCNRLFQKMKESGYKWNLETKTLEKLIELKFKVGDKVKDKNNRVWFIVQVSKKHFDISNVPNAEGYFVPIEDQDNYELVPNKFDISTLIPFESRVLVRDYNNGVWRVSFWGCLMDDNQYAFKYDTTRGCFKQCIPYEGNEHLLGKVDKCDDYYKTWE